MVKQRVLCLQLFTTAAVLGTYYERIDVNFKFLSSYKSRAHDHQISAAARAKPNKKGLFLFDVSLCK